MTPSKRSKHELKRIIEDVVREECEIDGLRVQFCVDEVETVGRPLTCLKVWATLHFIPSKTPFCCGEPNCHLGIFTERRARIEDDVRRRLSLRQALKIDFGVEHIGARYHEGVLFRPL